MSDVTLRELNQEVGCLVVLLFALVAVLIVFLIGVWGLGVRGASPVRREDLRCSAFVQPAPRGCVR